MKKKTKKVAIITGASRGIGKAIALKLDKEGFITVLVSRSPENLRSALKDFSKKAIAIPADVSEEKDVIAMVKKTIKKFGSIDVLVNNADSSAFGRVEQLSKKDFEQTVNTSLGGTLYCSREVIRQMKTQPQGGQIINISSIVARRLSSFPEKGLYSAVKAAIGVLAQSIQEEVRNNNIKIATIYPGLVLTESFLKRGLCDPEQLCRHALKLEDITWVIWMIINQGENSNISELIIESIRPMPPLIHNTSRS